VNPDAQAYLARRLALLRELTSRPNGGGDEAKRQSMAHITGALEAFRALGAVSDDEFLDWFERAGEAAGGSRGAVWTGYTATASASSRADIGRAANAPAVPWPPPLAQFVRLVPAPNEEREWFSGRLRFIAVELYDIEAVILWRMAPLPDVTQALPGETEAFARDIEGLPDEERRRMHLRRPNVLHLANRFGVTDDAGTAYAVRGGGASSTDRMAVGQLAIQPAPPPSAQQLSVDALGEVFTIPLSAS
jgi:hypothetical protein